MSEKYKRYRFFKDLEHHLFVYHAGSQVVNRLPVDFPILSEPGVRFQFWPKNRFSETAKCYSCCDTHGARSHCSQYIQDITTGNFANSCNIIMYEPGMLVFPVQTEGMHESERVSNSHKEEF